MNEIETKIVRLPNGNTEITFRWEGPPLDSPELLLEDVMETLAKRGNVKILE